MSFLLYMFLVLIISVVIALVVTPDSAEWQTFSTWATGARWVLVPSLIIFLPRIIAKLTKTPPVAGEALRYVRQCQGIMLVLFLILEGARGFFA